MKKAVFILLIFSFFLFTAAFVFSEDKPKEVYLSGDQAGIVEVEGEVTIVKSDGKAFKAEEGAVLEDGDRLVVSKGANVQVAFGKELDKTVRLNEESDCKLTPSKDVRLDLVKGKLFAVVRELGKDEKFDVSTPVAVCGVRGTTFEVVVLVDDVDVRTYEGSVFVQSLEDYKKGLAAVSWVKRGRRTRARRGWQALAVVDMTPKEIGFGTRHGKAVWAAVASYSTRRGKKFYEGISYLDPSNLHPKSPWKNLDTMSEKEKKKRAGAEFNEYMNRKKKPKKGGWKYSY